MRALAPHSPPQRPLIGRAATCEMLLSLLAPALQPHLVRPSAPRRAHLRMSSSPEAGSFELELFSPARLSLFLRVQPRADGLHDVARLSQAIDLGDRLQLARIPNTPSQAAGVVRPSRKTDPIKQHVEFSATPVGLPGLPAGLLREWPCSGSAKARQPGLLGPPARRLLYSFVFRYEQSHVPYLREKLPPQRRIDQCSRVATHRPARP